MNKRSLFSLAPNLNDAGGHMIEYQNCLEEAATRLGLKFSVLFPKRFSQQYSPKKNWIPFFYTNRLARWVDFCRLFRKKEEKIIFLESFNTTDLLVFTLAAFLFFQKTDLICLLYRYGLTPLDSAKKAHLFLNRILKRKCSDRLRMLTDSELIAEEYEHHIPFKMAVVPIPHTEQVNAIYRGQEKMVCWWPGAPRVAKGWKELRHLASLSRDTDKIELIAAEQSRLPHATLIADVLTREEYVRHLQSSDFILLPYDPEVYRSGTSGIFVEAVVAGKIPLVKKGSWLAYELQRHELPELIVDWENPAFFENLIDIAQNTLIREKLRKMQLAYAQFHSQETFTEKLRELLQ